MAITDLTLDLAYLGLYVMGDLVVWAAAGLISLAVADVIVSAVQAIRR